MRRYAWRGDFVECDVPDGPLDVADSWRHSNGRTNGLHLHLERFARSAGPLPDGFVDKLMPLLRDGELFPRIALSQGLLLLDVRSAHHSFSSAGVEVAGVYTNAWYWRRHMLFADVAEFGALWLAQWGANPVVDVSLPLDVGEWPRPVGFPTPTVWQFTSRGRVDGVDVDLNLAL